jgi:pilus assembly protein Flp/PilA
LIAIRENLRRLLAGDSGATAIEYGLIAALIAIAALGGMSSFAGGAGTMWGDIETKVSAAM